MNKSIILLGLLVLAGLFFAGGPPLDPYVFNMVMKMGCSYVRTPPNLFVSLNTTANGFNNTYAANFATLNSNLHSTITSMAANCAPTDRACIASYYHTFDGYMQQATLYYFKAGYLGVLHGTTTWNTVFTNYRNMHSTYRACLIPTP